MLYYCIENNAVSAVLEYLPSVPETVTVVEVNESQKQKIDAKTHYFDPQTRSVKPFTQEQLDQIQAPPKAGTFFVALGDRFAPEWADGPVEFVVDKSETDSTLVVINNTGSAIVCSASCNAGSFSEVEVEHNTKYFTKANQTPTPIGFLVFRPKN